MQELKLFPLIHKEYTHCYYYKNNFDTLKQTIVLVHGFAEDSFIWENIVPTIIETYNIIMPELPGTGKSAACPPTHGLDYLGEYILAILEKEQIKKCIYFGHSMGGYIGMYLLEKKPILFSGFSLVHSSAFADLPEKKEIRKKAIALIEAGGKDKFFYNLVHSIYHESFNTTHQAHLQRHYSIAQSISTAWTIAYYTAMMNRPDRSSALKTYKGITQLIVGKDDSAVPYSVSLQMSYLCNNTLLEVLEPCGHFSPFEHPQKLTTAIQYFISYLSLIGE